MSPPSAGEPCRIVLGPDVLARSFFCPHCYGVMQMWRNGEVRLVVTRALVLEYLKILSRMGIPHEQIRKWAWWFTSPDKVDFVEVAPDVEAGSASIAEQAARIGRAQGIVTAIDHRPIDGISIVSPGIFHAQ